MKNSLILCCCLLLCCCRSIHKKTILNLKQDSVRVLENREQQQLENITGQQHFVEEKSEGEYFLEIYSDTPYRLHPDKGLAVGAGYLKIRLSGKEQLNKRQTSSTKSNYSSTAQQQKEEKLKVGLVVKEKQSEKVAVPYIRYIVLCVGFVLLYLIYKSQRFRFGG